MHTCIVPFASFQNFSISASHFCSWAPFFIRRGLRLGNFYTQCNSGLNAWNNYSQCEWRVYLPVGMGEFWPHKNWIFVATVWKLRNSGKVVQYVCKHGCTYVCVCLSVCVYAVMSVNNDFTHFCLYVDRLVCLSVTPHLIWLSSKSDIISLFYWLSLYGKIMEYLLSFLCGRFVCALGSDYHSGCMRMHLPVGCVLVVCFTI